MTTLSRRVRWLAPPLTIALALGVVGALASPASAAQTTFTQDTDIGIGGANYTPTNTTALEIPSLGPATPSFPSEIVVTTRDHHRCERDAPRPQPHLVPTTSTSCWWAQAASSDPDERRRRQQRLDSRQRHVR